MPEDSPSTYPRVFRIHTRHSEDATIVECHGKLILETSSRLKSEVRSMIPAAKRIILDLKEVPLLDSFGLGTLVGLYISARTRGCKLELINTSQAVRQLLALSNLLSLFEPVGRHGGKLL
jgi:anti-anti-sigma factor